MNITKLVALAIAAIVVTGCATTPRTAQFNPNNKGIIFEDGKPYLIPYGSALIPKIGDSYVESRDIAVLNNHKIPHSCKKGDHWWVELTHGRSYAASHANTRTTMNKKEKMAASDALILAGFRAQRMGCTAPLSATEYDYYKNVEIQRTQQARHNQNLQMQQNTINAINSPTNCYRTYSGMTCY